MVRFSPEWLPVPRPGIRLVREARSPSCAYGMPADPGRLSATPAAPAPDQPSPDPFDDADALDDLGDEIATMAAHIHAATQRLLELLAEFDRRRGWEIGGHRSCAHWLAFRTGIDLGAARERVRAARALVELPETRARMGRGELSFAQVRALTRVATPENEAKLLDFAVGSTAAQLERFVRGWKVGSRQDEAAFERARHESRSLSVFPRDDGMYAVKGTLEPEVGVLLMRALEAAGDQIFRVEGPPPEMESEEESRRAAAQRRADALGLLAERALAAGFGRRQDDAREDEADDDDPNGVPVSGSRAERYQVVLHVDAQTLSADGEPERSELDDGTRVSAETSRRLACDTALVRMEHGPGGTIFDVGRRTRTIPPALRRALEARDRGCRFPGCGLRFTDGHHVKHWADGGETSLGNCLLLCHTTTASSTRPDGA